MNAERVKQVFAKVFECDPAVLGEGTSPADVPGWDSFGHLALVDALQAAFRIHFEVEDIAQMETLGHVLRIVTLRGGRR
jgi:acyl carrier protein